MTPIGSIFIKENKKNGGCGYVGTSPTNSIRELIWFSFAGVL